MKGRPTVTGTSDDDLVWDMTDWFIRVAEALDQLAADKGNFILYGTATLVQRVVTRVEIRPPKDERERR